MDIGQQVMSYYIVHQLFYVFFYDDDDGKYFHFLLCPINLSLYKSMSFAFSLILSLTPLEGNESVWYLAA